MNYTYVDAMTCVQNGADWLDEIRPGWEFTLDLGNLEMANCQQCVIGQAVGDYWETINTVFPDTMDLDEWHPWVVEHGFDTPSLAGLDGLSTDEILDLGHANYRILEEAWTDYVKAKINGSF